MKPLSEKHIRIVLKHLYSKVCGSFTEVGSSDSNVTEYVAAVNSFFGTSIESFGDIEIFSCNLFNEWQEKGSNVYFRTSGSTGIPKIVEFPKERYDSEIKSTMQLFASCKRIVSFAPTYHSYGFSMGVVLPARLGVEVLHFSPVPTVESLSAIRDGDAVIAFPIFWAAFAELNTHRKNITGVSSTGPLGKELFQKLIDNHTGKMIEIYGASELGVISYRFAPDEPFTLLDKFSRETIAHIMPDNVEWADNERFHLCGRFDKAVQVGGVNVYPDKINSIIMQNPAVEKSSVRLMKLTEGRRLKAFIVLKDKSADRTAALNDIKEWLDSHNFTTPEKIRSFTFGDSLPVNNMGKSADWDIATRSDKQ